MRVGIALYNAGRYLAAREPLEERWLGSPAGERGECLRGLVQASAAVYNSRGGNEPGAPDLAESAPDLAESASGHLDGCEVIDVDALGGWLDRLAADPTLGEREEPPEIRLDGPETVGPEAIGVYDLTPEGVVAAAEAVAGTTDDDLLRAAAGYAESALDDGDESSPFVTLTLDYVRDPTPIVRQRLREHVGRRRTRTADVEGLFE